MKISIKYIPIILGIFIEFGCFNSSENGKKNKQLSITMDSFLMIEEKCEPLHNSKGYIITFINGDCSYCTNRIPTFKGINKQFGKADLNFTLLIYSENSFSVLDTVLLQKKYETIPMVFDKYNIFQIKNKLPAYAEEYSIYVNTDLEVIDIGKPNEIFNQYCKN